MSKKIKKNHYIVIIGGEYHSSWWNIRPLCEHFELSYDKLNYQFRNDRPYEVGDIKVLRQRFEDNENI